MTKGTIHIGTSGWNYRHWRGRFYPEGLKAKDEFAYLTARFKTVELNNSFYRLPPAETFAKWKKISPPGFLFAVKAPRFITHMKKLKTDTSALQEFLDHAKKLGTKLGPILFQLPPKWKLNIQRLEEFLKTLPKRKLFTFEFRNAGWYTEEVYALLKKYNCAFCIYELEHHLSPLEVTADFIYIRLHGPGNKYQGSYEEATLAEWARRCKHWQQQGKDVYVYFDNDQEGYSAFNALRLIELTSGRSKP